MDCSETKIENIFTNQRSWLINVQIQSDNNKIKVTIGA